MAFPASQPLRHQDILIGDFRVCSRVRSPGRQGLRLHRGCRGAILGMQMVRVGFGPVCRKHCSEILSAGQCSSSGAPQVMVRSCCEAIGGVVSRFLGSAEIRDPETVPPQYRSGSGKVLAPLSLNTVSGAPSSSARLPGVAARSTFSTCRRNGLPAPAALSCPEIALWR